MVEMDILRGQRLDRRRKNNKLNAVLVVKIRRKSLPGSQRIPRLARKSAGSECQILSTSPCRAHVSVNCCLHTTTPIL
jgi:hypothetical protein